MLRRNVNNLNSVNQNSSLTYLTNVYSPLVVYVVILKHFSKHKQYFCVNQQYSEASKFHGTSYLHIYNICLGSLMYGSAILYFRSMSLAKIVIFRQIIRLTKLSQHSQNCKFILNEQNQEHEFLNLNLNIVSIPFHIKLIRRIQNFILVLL